MSVITEKKLNRENLNLQTKSPIKVVQFGEGNFLRAFVEYAFDKLNKEANFNAGIAVVQPIDRGLIELLNNQDGLFTLFLKGIQKGEIIEHKQLISNIVKGVNPFSDFQDYLDLAKEDALQFIISNTTESGIAFVESDLPNMSPPSSFPAKLTLLLFERFKHFNGNKDKGLTIIPCELINHNADTLKSIILKYIALWKLDGAFKDWINNACSFHNTLVDRIVPGYPNDSIEAYNSELDYQDDLIVTAESFFLWVIEGDEKLKEKLPFHKTKLNVKIVKDMQPYRTIKVRILNGAHTSMVPFSLLFGNETVKETVDHPFTGDFVTKVIFEEINEILALDQSELDTYAAEVLDRFRNPFIKHKLADIALNSISKFEVRVLPSLLEYVARKDKLPTHLTFALACLIRFYKGSWKGQPLTVNDSDDIISEFNSIWTTNDLKQVAISALQNVDFWAQDLNKIKNLTEAVTFALTEIETNGIEQGFINFKKKF